MVLNTYKVWVICIQRNPVIRPVAILLVVLPVFYTWQGEQTSYKEIKQQSKELVHHTHPENNNNINMHTFTS